MTPAEYLLYVNTALSSLALLGHLKGYFSSGEKSLGDRLTKAEEKLVSHDRRIQAAEAEIQHLPDKDTAHKLELALIQISGRLDTLDERLSPIAATSVRLQEYLLDQAKK